MSYVKNGIRSLKSERGYYAENIVFFNCNDLFSRLGCQRIYV